MRWRRGGALGVELGEPRYDDDRWDEKLALAREERVPVVAFTFGCPDADVVALAPGRRLCGVGDRHDAGRGACAADAGPTR
jgi:nitronate monooxygenase